MLYSHQSRRNFTCDGRASLAFLISSLAALLIFPAFAALAAPVEFERLVYNPDATLPPTEDAPEIDRVLQLQNPSGRVIGAVDVSGDLAVFTSVGIDVGIRPDGAATGDLEPDGVEVRRLSTGEVLHQLQIPSVGLATLSDGTTELRNFNGGSGAAGQFGRAAVIDGDFVLVQSERASGNPAGGLLPQDEDHYHLFNAMTGDHVRAFIANPNSAGDASFDLQAERILIGDSVESRVRLFDVDGDLLQTIDDPVSVFDPDSRFGQVVALDGDRILVSDYNAGNVGDVLLGDGAVYQFGTDGQLVRTFTPPPRDPLEPDETQRFGFSLDIEGDLIVIGDPHRAVGVTDAGEVFVYSAATGELLRRFFSADPSDGYDRTGFERNSGFGVSVDLDGDYLAILASGAFQSTPEGEDDTVFASVYDLTFDEIAPRFIFQDQNLGFSHFTSFNSEAGLRTPVSPHSIAIEDGVVVFSDFNNVGQFNIFGNSAPIEAIVFTLPEAEINAVPLPQTIWLFAAALALFVRLKPGRPACA